MFEMKTIGKPCAGKPHARFDEEVQNCLKESGSGFTLLVNKLVQALFLNELLRRRMPGIQHKL